MRETSKFASLVELSILISFHLNVDSFFKLCLEIGKKKSGP